MTNLNRPVIIIGYKLKNKIWKQIDNLNEQLIEIDNLVNSQYSNCIEGSLKSTQRREILKKRSELEHLKDQKYILYKQIKFWRIYALEIKEALDHEIIKVPKIKE
jgi:tRNA splicing endonuclease